METFEISVIIPVYNTSEYLAECLESILQQTLRNIEVICVNDGSTDNSLQILQEVQKKDSRIKIIDQQNQGVSAARNAGLEAATGKYIGFVDGDDTVEHDFFAQLYHFAEQTNADAVYSKMDERQPFPLAKKIFGRHEITAELLPVYFKEDSLNSVCIKIFRNRTVQEYGLKFPVGIKHGEDAQFNIEFLMHAEKIALLNVSGYHYREVEGSATRNILRHDYLGRIVQVYETDWTPVIGDAIPERQMQKLKRIRLADSVISLVYIYANRGNSFTDRQRFKKLREIVNHPAVKKVFAETELLGELQLDRYSALVFTQIKKQNVFLLYLLTQYSYYRGK